MDLMGLIKQIRSIRLKAVSSLSLSLISMLGFGAVRANQEEEIQPEYGVRPQPLYGVIQPRIKYVDHTVKGTVKTSSHVPVEGIKVRLTKGNMPLDSVLTDSDGYYILKFTDQGNSSGQITLNLTDSDGRQNGWFMPADSTVKYTRSNTSDDIIINFTLKNK